MDPHEHAIERAESGTALILGLIFVAVAAGVVAVGTILENTRRAKSDLSFRLNGQANQFARSGLTEALGWFRKQTSQPVTAFAPAVDPGARPPLLETDDPEIGLVREYPIRGDVWGRYEVWKRWDADPDSERYAWRQRMQARDVSELRDLDADGAHWRLRSIGYVFLRRDSSRRFDDGPNVVVAVRMLEAEIRRMRISLPGRAALSVADGNSAHVNTMGRVIGADGAGIVYPAGTGTPTIGPPNAERVTGDPPLAPTAAFAGDVRSVFGVDRAALRAMATDVVTAAAAFPSPIPANGLVYAEAPAIAFDQVLPLRGTGVVYIKGNVTLLPGNGSDFAGLLYVDGNLTVRAPCELAGAVIATGNMTLQGSTEYATIRFDERVLDTLRQSIGQYRWQGAVRPVLSTD